MFVLLGFTTFRGVLRICCLSGAVVMNRWSPNLLALVGCGCHFLVLCQLSCYPNSSILMTQTRSRTQTELSCQGIQLVCFDPNSVFMVRDKTMFLSLHDT
ncbi:hypothetical protein CSKR_202244 [Clonorchis sinensis]|uniref:Uncharacterized protein n=1 Tax=Clonorchis sinensis TaxID=79923 RepID=A0A8T1LX90_CLOSI|nr:hypothetical protein CSKR_202244 [Clonorchis sinensis]